MPLSKTSIDKYNAYHTRSPLLETLLKRRLEQAISTVLMTPTQPVLFELIKEFTTEISDSKNGWTWQQHVKMREYLLKFLTSKPVSSMLHSNSNNNHHNHNHVLKSLVYTSLIGLHMGGNYDARFFVDFKKKEMNSALKRYGNGMMF